MRDILDAGQGAIIFTSKPAPGLDRQLAVALSEKICEVCFEDKHHQPGDTRTSQVFS